jgi:hypothetical protein
MAGLVADLQNSGIEPSFRCPKEESACQNASVVGGGTLTHGYDALKSYSFSYKPPWKQAWLTHVIMMRLIQTDGEYFFNAKVASGSRII